MEKIKLSEMITYYESKKGNKDSLFGDYFEEKDIDQKLARLKLMQETIGNIELPLEQIRVFLYAGKMFQNKNEFQFTQSMIKDVTEIAQEKEDMPKEFLLTLLNTYDEEVYKKSNIKEWINKVIKEEQEPRQLIDRYYDYLGRIKNKIEVFYEEEKKKLEELKETYSPKFIERLQEIIIEKHITAEEVIKLIPSPEFIGKVTSDAPAIYNVIAGEEIVTRILHGYIDLDKFDEDEKIILGYTQYDTKITASFTKKEYLEEIEDKKQIKR